MVSWITYHDGTEPYVSMAHRLSESIRDCEAGVLYTATLTPNGGNLFAEAMGRTYDFFSDMIDEGPVVLIDADCIVQKPLDDLLDKEWAIAAVHRGKCSNSMGPQNYLSTVVMFDDRDPNWARYLWCSWLSKIMAMARMGTPVEGAAERNARLKGVGWSPNWYCDQTALNQLLRELERSDIPIRRLNREFYAAAPGTEKAYIIHHKGSGKLK